MAGMPYPPKYVLWAVHLCLVGAAETAAPPGGTSVNSVHSVGEHALFACILVPRLLKN